MSTVAELQELLGITFFDYQIDCFTLWEQQSGPGRICLYYRTGAGKSVTSLAAVSQRGFTEALVIAPPITKESWQELGEKIGVDVEVVSHAKFRMPDFKLSRKKPVIADEFHLFGGYSGKGWKKLDRLAASLDAPLILCSATPNYNDAERCYCIQHVLDPASVRGGYLEFLYQNCTTEQNPFGQMPKVTGFQRFPDAESYLAALPYVVYVPDETVYHIVDIPLQSHVPSEFHRFGLNRVSQRIMASGMEATFQEMYLNLVTEEGLLHDDVYDTLENLVGQAPTPVLLYCDSSRVAQAVFDSCKRRNVNVRLLTGKTKAADKASAVNEFKSGKLDVLVGTATLATGTDGFDKVCDLMVIVNDTSDNAKRRQLIGRILPRGEDTDSSKKRIYRLVF